MKETDNELRAWHDVGYLILDNDHHEIKKVKM